MASLQLLGFGSNGWGALLLVAALMTLAVTATALAIGAVLGAVIAFAKLSGSLVLKTLGNIYTTVFRGVPELLIIYLIYFGGSSAVTSIGKWLGYEGFLGLPSFAAGALAVGIISGAYQAEVFRGAYLAISKGELEAASAIGMHRGLAIPLGTRGLVGRHAVVLQRPDLRRRHLRPVAHGDPAQVAEAPLFGQQQVLALVLGLFEAR